MYVYILLEVDRYQGIGFLPKNIIFQRKISMDYEKIEFSTV